MKYQGQGGSLLYCILIWIVYMGKYKHVNKIHSYDIKSVIHQHPTASIETDCLGSNEITGLQ